MQVRWVALNRRNVNRTSAGITLGKIRAQHRAFNKVRIQNASSKDIRSIGGQGLRRSDGLCRVAGLLWRKIVGLSELFCWTGRGTSQGTLLPPQTSWNRSGGAHDFLRSIPAFGAKAVPPSNAISDCGR